MDTDRLASIIDKSFLTASGRKEAEGILLSWLDSIGISFFKYAEGERYIKSQNDFINS